VAAAPFRGGACQKAKIKPARIRITTGTPATESVCAPTAASCGRWNRRAGRNFICVSAPPPIRHSRNIPACRCCSAKAANRRSNRGPSAGNAMRVIRITAQNSQSGYGEDDFPAALTRRFDHVDENSWCKRHPDVRGLNDRCAPGLEQERRFATIDWLGIHGCVRACSCLGRESSAGTAPSLVTAAAST